MATQPEDDEPLELTEELEPDDESEEQDEDEETVVAFEDEEPEEPQPENSVIRQMRQELRETKRKLAEAEKAAAPKPVTVGPKPSLYDDECDGDEELYEKRLLEWHNEVAAADREAEAEAEKGRKANEAWQQDLAAFETKKAGLQFEDRDDVIETASSALDMVQQAVVVKAAADPALFLYALGKSEAKRAELAKIQDPIKLAAAVARMEGAVKVTKGRKAPEPDTPLRGSAALPGSADKELEKLEKKALQTGDRTELIAYKKRIADAAKAK